MGFDNFCSIKFKRLQKSSLPNFGNTGMVQKEISKTSHIPKRYMKYAFLFTANAQFYKQFSNFFFFYFKGDNYYIPSATLRK